MQASLFVPHCLHAEPLSAGSPGFPDFVLPGGCPSRRLDRGLKFYLIWEGKILQLASSEAFTEMQPHYVKYVVELRDLYNRTHVQECEKKIYFSNAAERHHHGPSRLLAQPPEIQGEPTDKGSTQTTGRRLGSPRVVDFGLPGGCASRPHLEILYNPGLCASGQLDRNLHIFT